jgi:hypothetical protein
MLLIQSKLERRQSLAYYLPSAAAASQEVQKHWGQVNSSASPKVAEVPVCEANQLSLQFVTKRS